MHFVRLGFYDFGLKYGINGFSPLFFRFGNEMRVDQILLYEIYCSKLGGG
ncbi:hypothetical protein DYBT9275_02014 [Dyadobacter sp. CECT 9275]|uniref:Uncharacterized protein n=1 Tax=Dyadobacter helix TaxID=2822344 RepID=A0A916NL11_9BACT|nr:hypothetical protein DYBT9275_02014 [Dyadobacter sp. CECT 9275]